MALNETNQIRLGIDRNVTVTVMDSIHRMLVLGSSMDESHQTSGPVHVSELTPVDCGTLTTTMKSLISGFTHILGTGDLVCVGLAMTFRGLLMYSMKGRRRTSFTPSSTI